jgi:uncharacterized protein
MEYSSVPVEIPQKSWINRIQALFEVLLISGIISGLLAAIPIFGLRGGSGSFLLEDARTVSYYLLLDSGITFLLLAFILKAHRETIASLGLRWDNLKRNVIAGLMLVPLLFLINAIAALLFKIYLPKYYIEQNPLTDIIHTPQQLALFIFSALVAGGIKEELQRALIINRFRAFLGGAGVGLVLWSLAFGAGHYLQGVQGIVIAAIYGFFFGMIYILSGSLIAPIVAHGTYDTLALLAYWFLSSRIK